VKPAPFEYERPASLDLAVKALMAAAGEARILAGGQSLGPMLNLRLATPARLIDVGSIASLKRIEQQSATFVVGAGVTHAMLEDRHLKSPTDQLLAHVASTIAYRAIRTRGTIGGSLAHSDPAADWVTTMVLLDARLTVVGSADSRQVPAQAFFKGAFTNDLGLGDILESVSFTTLSPDARWGYHKVCRKVGEFPEAIGAIILDRARQVARIVVGALDGPPVVLAELAKAVASRGLEAASLTAVKDALRVVPGLDPIDLQLHAVAVRRAIIQAVSP
jgi:carbon-monoxide dehydrogenase medium subunit